MYYSIYCIYHIYIYICVNVQEFLFLAISFQFSRASCSCSILVFGTCVYKHTDKSDKTNVLHTYLEPFDDPWLKCWGGWPVPQKAIGCSPQVKYTVWIICFGSIQPLIYILYITYTYGTYVLNYILEKTTQTYTSCQPREQQKNLWTSTVVPKRLVFSSPKRPPSPWSSMSLVMSNFGFFKIFTSNKTQPPKPGDDPRKVWLPQP